MAKKTAFPFGALSIMSFVAVFLCSPVLAADVAINFNGYTPGELEGQGGWFEYQFSSPGLSDRVLATSTVECAVFGSSLCGEMRSAGGYQYIAYDFSDEITNDLGAIGFDLYSNNTSLYGLNIVNVVATTSTTTASYLAVSSYGESSYGSSLLIVTPDDGQYVDYDVTKPVQIIFSWYGNSYVIRVIQEDEIIYNFNGVLDGIYSWLRPEYLTLASHTNPGGSALGTFIDNISINGATGEGDLMSTSTPSVSDLSMFEFGDDPEMLALTSALQNNAPFSIFFQIGSIIENVQATSTEVSLALDTPSSTLLDSMNIPLFNEDIINQYIGNDNLNLIRTLLAWSLWVSLAVFLFYKFRTVF